MTARELADYLYRGGRLQPQCHNLPRTFPGEEVYAQVGVRQQMFLPGGDGSWVKHSAIPLSPMGAALRVGMAVGNGHRKRQARREAEERWRDVDGGALYITNQRLVMQLGRQWDVVDLRSVMALHYEGDALVMEFAGGAPVRLVMDAADYHFVMLYFVVFGQVVLP